MQLRTPTDDFLQNITAPDGTINLSMLEKRPGGGTHDIYASKEHPKLLLKVMRRTIGKDDNVLTDHLEKLTAQSSALYETFDESRCIVEKRSIQAIRSDATDNLSRHAIVSVVPVDGCFVSEERFGFNVEPIEESGGLINRNRYEYDRVNKSLLDELEKPDESVLKDFTLLNKKFEPIFKLLETEPSLQNAMREFLLKYHVFYKKTGILLDTIGYDNVLFFKNEAGWQFKLGSVIKHDTGALTKTMLNQIIKDPATINASFEHFTSICFMPSCIRALNACAAKLGMRKVIDDIKIDEKTITALAEIHTQAHPEQRAIQYAREANFSVALIFYAQQVKITESEKIDNSFLRGTLGSIYWDHIKNGGKESSRDEIETFLKLLRDERNNFPAEDHKVKVKDAIEGLENKLLSIDCKPRSNF